MGCDIFRHGEGLLQCVVEEGRNTIGERGSSPGGGWDQGRRRGQGLDLKHDTTTNHGGIVKTLDQFLEYGCENCPFLAEG